MYNRKVDYRDTIIIPGWIDLNRYWKPKVVEDLCKAAADKIAAANKLHKWLSCNKLKLVVWSNEEKQFLNFDIDSFSAWMGKEFKVVDTHNQEFLGPCRSVSDKIWRYLLDNPDVPLANYQLEIQMKKEGN
jgi:hypothetical protein